MRDLDGKQPVAAVPTIPDRLADALLETGKAMTSTAPGGVIGETVPAVARALGREIKDKGGASRFKRVRNGLVAQRTPDDE